MRRIALLTVALALFGTVTAAAKTSPEGHHFAAGGPPMTAVRYVDGRPRPTGFQKIELFCDNAGLGGGCPTPRQECRDRCYEVHEAEIFACFTGSEGILSFQREACYVRSVARFAACNSQCVQDFPV